MVDVKFPKETKLVDEIREVAKKHGVTIIEVEKGRKNTTSLTLLDRSKKINFGNTSDFIYMSK